MSQAQSMSQVNKQNIHIEHLKDKIDNHFNL